MKDRKQAQDFFARIFFLENLRNRSRCSLARTLAEVTPKFKIFTVYAITFSFSKKQNWFIQYTHYFCETHCHGRVHILEVYASFFSQYMVCIFVIL